MEFKINDILRRYRAYIKKAKRLGTTDNDFYREKLQVIQYLEELKTLQGDKQVSEQHIQTPVPELINSSCNQIMFNNIDKALGIHLFEWQKVYILTGSIKRTGQMTAAILRQLLQNLSDPIDVSTLASIDYYYKCSCEEERYRYITKVKEIHAALADAGIPVRRILRNPFEFECYIAEMPDAEKINATKQIHVGNFVVKKYIDR